MLFFFCKNKKKRLPVVTSCSPTITPTLFAFLFITQCAAVNKCCCDMIVAPQYISLRTESTRPAIMGYSFTPVCTPPTIFVCDRNIRVSKINQIYMIVIFILVSTHVCTGFFHPHLQSSVFSASSTACNSQSSLTPDDQNEVDN